MERPRIFLGTFTTSSTNYEPLVDVRISDDALGISYLTMAIDPDPNALYKIIVGRVMSVNETELTAVWSLHLPHLTYGFMTAFVLETESSLRTDRKIPR
jgi:hypothetical protein